MKKEYRISTSQILLNDGDTLISYGIELENNGEVIACVNDISVNAKAVTEFVRILNEVKLDPVHLAEVVEDNIDDLI